MFDTQNPVRERGILDAIQTVANNGESGRLAMRTGTTEGVFFFNNGLLVDARVGNLTGFQAINAAASMRDASWRFDPSVVPPPFSSIRPNERVILKQFFGIDTIAPEETHEAEQLMPDQYDEVTLAVPAAAAPGEPVLISSNVPDPELPAPLPYERASSSFLRGGLMIALLLVLLATTGVALLYSFGGRPKPATVAATSEASAPPVAERVEPIKQPDSTRAAELNKVAVNIKETTANRKETAAVRNDDTPARKDTAEDMPVDKNETAAARDLSGRWNIVNTVNKTSYRSFDNMEIGFNLSIEQNGKGFTGSGQKVSENGRTLRAGSRTPIQVEGLINGDRVEATFYEQGTARKTNGRFVWRIDKAGRLTGTFNSTAARTSGKSTARKV
jgi:hypothetical protein